MFMRVASTSYKGAGQKPESTPTDGQPPRCRHTSRQFDTLPIRMLKLFSLFANLSIGKYVAR